MRASARLRARERERVCKWKYFGFVLFCLFITLIWREEMQEFKKHKNSWNYVGTRISLFCLFAALIWREKRIKDTKICENTADTKILHMIWKAKKTRMRAKRASEFRLFRRKIFFFYDFCLNFNCITLLRLLERRRRGCEQS